MADPRPEFVLPQNRRGLFYFLLVASLLFAAWFFVVLLGENQAWGDDPGRWAFLPTFVWGLMGVVPFILLIAYSLALLTIKEREGQVYRLETAEGAPAATPSFLQPPEPPTTTADTTEQGAPPQ